MADVHLYRVNSSLNVMDFLEKSLFEGRSRKWPCYGRVSLTAGGVNSIRSAVEQHHRFIVVVRR